MTTIHVRTQNLGNFMLEVSGHEALAEALSGTLTAHVPGASYTRIVPCRRRAYRYTVVGYDGSVITQGKLWPRAA